MTDWQPIETAPKDGTWVLLGGCEFGYIIQTARWYDWGVQGWEWGDYSNRGFKPTHWMPLPEPPKTDEDQ
ncbi:MAG: DUF551 domain-containing protein [Pseudomonadales bacterium]